MLPLGGNGGGKVEEMHGNRVRPTLGFWRVVYELVIVTVTLKIVTRIPLIAAQCVGLFV